MLGLFIMAKCSDVGAVQTCHWRDKRTDPWF